MKILLYPLMGVLFVADRLFIALSFNGEVSVILAGIFAAAAIGFIYYGPILVAVERFTQPNRFRTCSLWSVGASCFGLLLLGVGELASAAALLMAGAVLTVLSFSSLGSLSAVYFAHFVGKRLRRK